MISEVGPRSLGFDQRNYLVGLSQREVDLSAALTAPEMLVLDLLVGGGVPPQAVQNGTQDTELGRFLVLR